ncbi:emp24/gp25L/p24 family/GOLD-domain-containing protein [Catenaria anguillulae PL171]|uniref:Emp24/gp25L/p24 family/GOLD-domain-containing protein n=1 Tax=Catenaria anguillulae PL171 TaxID=765915 RepID=A0A1Y2HRA4_9FUNG|nr:emp24/gp25L/p24 family/GOLD-domain-containing protein [Catenaria anguillulae PL171]
MRPSSSSRANLRRHQPSWALVVLILVACLAHSARALHFYLEDNKEKCFMEVLPQDTAVMGVYRAEEWSAPTQQYIENLSLGIQINVEHVETQSVTVSKKGPSFGKFLFTAAHSGDHKICLSTNTSGWFNTSKVRLHLDIIIGDAAGTEVDPSERISDIQFRIRDLIHRAVDIRREQQYQREQEREFREFTDLVNRRVVLWSIVQMIVLGLACAWQLRHLRSFFMAKKLV